MAETPRTKDDASVKPDEQTDKTPRGAQPRHTVRGVHEQAAEEQRQLGRKVDQQVDPDKYARWRDGQPRASDMPIDTQPPTDDATAGTPEGGKGSR